jgi:hypothetical protein
MVNFVSVLYFPLFLSILVLMVFIVKFLYAQYIKLFDFHSSCITESLCYIICVSQQRSLSGTLK